MSSSKCPEIRTRSSTAIATVREGAADRVLGSPRGATDALDLAGLRRKRVRIVGAHVSTLTRTRGGSGWVDAAERYLADVAAGRLDPDRLVTDKIEPDEAATLYRRLGRGDAVVGVLIDWSALPAEERAAPVSALSLPSMGAAGADPSQALLHSRMLPSPADADPFAGARGELRFGLIGCGDVAAQNAGALRLAPNTSLVACFDTAPALAEDLARTHGIDASGSFDELLDRRDIDAVFLAVPHHLHAPLALEAFAAGKHVIVEKPPANDLRGALELRDAAQAAGLALSYCFPQRYGGRAAAVKQLIEAGRSASCAARSSPISPTRPISTGAVGSAAVRGRNGASRAHRQVAAS